MLFLLSVCPGQADSSEPSTPLVHLLIHIADI